MCVNRLLSPEDGAISQLIKRTEQRHALKNSWKLKPKTMRPKCLFATRYDERLTPGLPLHWIHLSTGKLVSVWNALCLVLYKLTAIPTFSSLMLPHPKRYKYLLLSRFCTWWGPTTDDMLIHTMPNTALCDSFVNMLLFFRIVLRLSLKLCVILFIRFLKVLKVYQSNVSTSDQQSLIATGNSTEMVLAGVWLNIYVRIWVYWVVSALLC